MTDSKESKHRQMASLSPPRVVTKELAMEPESRAEAAVEVQRLLTEQPMDLSPHVTQGQLEVPRRSRQELKEEKELSQAKTDPQFVAEIQHLHQKLSKQEKDTVRHVCAVLVEREELLEEKQEMSGTIEKLQEELKTARDELTTTKNDLTTTKDDLETAEVKLKTMREAHADEEKRMERQYNSLFEEEQFVIRQLNTEEMRLYEVMKEKVTLEKTLKEEQNARQTAEKERNGLKKDLEELKKKNDVIMTGMDQKRRELEYQIKELKREPLHMLQEVEDASDSAAQENHTLAVPASSNSQKCPICDGAMEEGQRHYCSLGQQQQQPIRPSLANLPLYPKKTVTKRYGINLQAAMRRRSCPF